MSQPPPSFGPPQQDDRDLIVQHLAQIRTYVGVCALASIVSLIGVAYVLIEGLTVR